MAKKKNATRRILYIVLGLVVLIAILGAIGKATGIFGERDKSIAVETMPVEIRDITQVVTASGNVQPELEVRISPDVAGEIIALPIKEGDQVKRGALLARIKPDVYVAQVEQAEAGVLQSKASEAQRKADLINAEYEAKRQETLYQKQAIAESEYLRAKTQHEVAQASFDAARYAVQSAEARLRERKEELSRTSIFAPMDGTISVLAVELGDRVVGSNMMSGTEMMRIAKLDRMEMEVDVNENDVVNVVLGDTATIEVDAYPERDFKGVVTEIANSARTTGSGTQEQVTNFPVKIRILDAHNVDLTMMGQGRGGSMTDEEVPSATGETPNFRPGMSGTVDIFTKTIRQAVAVPIQAVTVRDFNAIKKDSTDKNTSDVEEEGSEETLAEGAGESAGPPKGEDLRKVVFLMEDGIARIIEVETGISDDSYVEIRTGLLGEETVITGPYRVVSRTLKPDDEVKKREEGRGPGGRPVAEAN